MKKAIILLKKKNVTSVKKKSIKKTNVKKKSIIVVETIFLIWLNSKNVLFQQQILKHESNRRKNYFDSSLIILPSHMQDWTGIPSIIRPGCNHCAVGRCESHLFFLVFVSNLLVSISGSTAPVSDDFSSRDQFENFGQC